MSEKDAIEVVMHVFNEFKNANDENLKKRDTLLEAKIENASKCKQEQLDRVEELLNRPLNGVSKDG